MKAIHVRIPEKLYQTVKVLCAIHGESLMQFTDHALTARCEGMGLKAAASPSPEKEPVTVDALAKD